MTAAPSHPMASFDPAVFPRHDALMAMLRAAAAARPDIVTLGSLGTSHEGRDIPLVTITRRATGPDTDKPAFWVDGNIHAAELLACNACLYWLAHLMREDGRDASVTHLLDTRTVYMAPRLNPDGAELALADQPRHIRSSTRPYPFDEPTVDGLTVQDMDGDGRILTMRIADPNGAWKPHPQQPRILVPREPGDVSGTFYRVMPEGRLDAWDGVTIHVNPDREGLDLNRNFPANWRHEAEQVGAGPYPTSEPEVRAMVDFIVRHPNIGAAVSFHTHSGVILRPMGTQKDDDMIPEDLWVIQRLSKLGEQMTGYPSVSIWHEFRYHPKEVITGTQDWLYEHLGALFWTVELWAPNREAGITGYDWIHWYRDHPPEDDLKLLAWSDRECGGKAHVDWYPFEHPQLGRVELGGWDRMNYWRNPPPHKREDEIARFPGWLGTLALALPRLELLSLTAEAAGDDRWHVRLALANAGYLPSNISRRALERKVVRGVVAEIDLAPPEAGANAAGARLVTGRPREVRDSLGGHGHSTSMQAFLPNRSVTADRAVIDWWVEAPRGTVIAVAASADRAGRMRRTITLGG